MTHCYNCGHAGTFVLLVQFALAVPGPDAHVPRATPDHDGRSSTGRGSPDRGSPDCGDAVHDRPDRADPVRGRWPRCGDGSRRRDRSRHVNGSRTGADAGRGNGSRREASSGRGDGPHCGDDSRCGDGPRHGNGFDRDGRLEPGDLPTGGDLSFAVQCPACDSTDVGVAAADLLARYGSTTTS